MRKSVQWVAHVLLLSLLAVSVGGCWSDPTAEATIEGEGLLPAYGVITTDEAVQVLQAMGDEEDFVLLDIRTPAEVEAGHISGAVTIDFYDPSFRENLSRLDREKTYLIYCRTANRTGQAFKVMEELGFERVYDMGGGISQWMASNYPTCLGPIDAEHTCTGELPQV